MPSQEGVSCTNKRYNNNNRRTSPVSSERLWASRIQMRVEQIRVSHLRREVSGIDREGGSSTPSNR